MSSLRGFIGHRFVQAFFILGVALMVAVGMSILQGAHDVAVVESNSLEVAPTQGSLAPNFTLTTVDGEEVSLSQFRGRIVLLNFWATWCGPCQIEMPAIQSRFEQLEDDGFVVLAVNFDEPQPAVASFRDEFGLSFELLLDPGAQVQRLYHNRGYPTTFFIDEHGVIEVQHIGVMAEGQLDGYLEQLGLTS